MNSPGLIRVPQQNGGNLAGPRHPVSIDVTPGRGGRPGLQPRGLPSLVMGLVLTLLLVLPAGCNRQPRGSASPEPLAPTPPAGRLQEVAPPIAVQQLQLALADRDPRVAIELPADGATLPAGDWTMRLRVRDWPLADAGALGVGAHVALQIDEQPVLRLTEHRTTPTGDVVEVSLPPLSAGSHRITAYAARPWGEAVKHPGASARLRVQVVAGNPLALPAPGSPELVAVSPTDWSVAEPVLLDWLLYDAPLQHLREGDGSWRLRVSVNGDAFLMDQNTPLWLRGWKSGSNALQLELVDGRGDPLNPPFNSLVREVNLGRSPRPRWMGERLSPEELATLLGETPPQAPVAVDATAPPSEVEPAKPEPSPSQPEVNAPDPTETPVGLPAAVQPDPADPLEVEAVPSPAPEPSEDEENEAFNEEPSPPAPQSAQTSPADAQEAPVPTAPVTAAGPVANPERVVAGTSLMGSARSEVKADGTLIKPSAGGPLAGLRERLAGS